MIVPLYQNLFFLQEESGEDQNYCKTSWEQVELWVFVLFIYVVNKCCGFVVHVF